MKFQRNFLHNRSTPSSFLLVLVLFQPGFCVFQSWFSNTKLNVSSLTLPQPLLKRQATISSQEDAERDPNSSNVDLTIPMVFGEMCEINGRTCDEKRFLECIDGKCMCRNPMHYAFDEDLGQCVGLSGSVCGNGKPSCVKNSQCLFGSCQCLDKFTETTTKVCMMNRGEVCIPGKMECNPDSGLGCMRGRCQCMDSVLVFDPFSRKCRNPQVEFDKFTRTVGRDVVQRVIARTVSDATSLVFLPFRLLVPGLG